MYHYTVSLSIFTGKGYHAFFPNSSQIFDITLDENLESHLCIFQFLIKSSSKIPKLKGEYWEKLAELVNSKSRMAWSWS